MPWLTRSRSWHQGPVPMLCQSSPQRSWTAAAPLFLDPFRAMVASGLWLRDWIGSGTLATRSWAWLAPLWRPRPGRHPRPLGPRRLKHGQLPGLPPPRLGGDRRLPNTTPLRQAPVPRGRPVDRRRAADPQRRGMRQPHGAPRGAHRKAAAEGSYSCYTRLKGALRGVPWFKGCMATSRWRCWIISSLRRHERSSKRRLSSIFGLIGVTSWAHRSSLSCGCGLTVALYGLQGPFNLRE